MKRKIILAILSFVFFHQTFSQAPSWQWVRYGGGPSYDIQGTSVSTDASGNVYVGGSFHDTTATFGSVSLPNSGLGDIFIVKYDALGNVLWAVGAGGISSDEMRAITVDDAGNVIITGIYDSPSLTFGSTTLSNGGSYDMFVAKFDSSGTALWAKRAGGVNREWGDGVASDASGNVFVTGAFESTTVTFGATTLTNSSANYEDVFLVKYDAGGNVLWARKAGGTMDEWATAVTTDDFGNTFISGPSFSSVISFGSTNLTNSNFEQLFVAKYNSSGTLNWAKSIVLGALTWNSYLSVLTSDAFGNLFFAGHCMLCDTVHVDNIILIDTVGGSDMIIAKYDSGGSVIWAKRPNGGSTGAFMIYPMGADADASGNVYIAGYFEGDSIIFDTTTSVAASQYYHDLFLVKYSPIGNTMWAKVQGGLYLPYLEDHSQLGVHCDLNGNVYATGCFIDDSLAFDLDTAYNSNYLVYPNCFLAKLNDSGACAANFTLYPDTSTLHHYWAVNNAYGTPPLSYDWDWGDGSPHDFTAYPSHTYATAGYYTICLTITDATSCTNTVCQTNNLQLPPNSTPPVTMVDVNVVAFIPTLISENLSQSPVLIFPNPLTTEVTLNFNSGKQHTVQLFNGYGEILFQKVIREEQIKLNMSDYPNGIYFVSVRDEKNNLIVKKIVKM